MATDNSITNLLVSFDQQGIPERCVGLREMAWREKDQAWRTYLNEEIEIGFIGSVPPMGRVCRYELPVGLLPEGSFRDLLFGDEKLNFFLQNHELEPIDEFPRRQVIAYGFTMGNINELTEIKALVDRDSAGSEICKTVEAAMQRMDEMDTMCGWSRFVRAVETDKGVLLFPDSGRGYYCFNSFMQFVADNFYNERGKNFGKIRVLKINGPSQQLQSGAIQTTRMFSMESYPAFYPERILYREHNIPEINKKREPSIRISPVTYSAFSEFVVMNGLKTNEKNKTIRTLLYVEQFGWTHIIKDRKPLLPEFRPMIEAVENLRSADMNASRIQSEIKQLATRILRDKYSVCITNEPYQIKFRKPIKL